MERDRGQSVVAYMLFFFSSRRRRTRCLSDWSSDVCSSDLSTSPATFRRGCLRLLALGDFFHPESRDLSNQLHGDGLGERKADCALVDLVRCKLRLKCRYYLLRSGVDRIVLLPHSKIKQAT